MSQKKLKKSWRAFVNLDKLTRYEISQILNVDWFFHLEQTFDIEDEIDRILIDEIERKNYGEIVERLTMYALFARLIAKFHMQILDSPNLCKLGFVRYGFSEDDLEVRLFFLLLDKNVTLEARKTTYSNKNFTSYSLSIFLYTKIFGTEKLPNEYEAILLKQTGLIVDVLVQEQIIQLNFEKKVHKEKHRDFSSALDNIIQLYGTEILLNIKKLNAVFKDIAEFDDINNDINHFLPILENLNKGEVDFSHETIKYYLNMLHEVISKQNKLYTPLPKAYNAYLKKLKEQEQYAVFLKKQEEEREQRFWEEWQKKEKRTKIFKIIIIPIIFVIISGIALFTSSNDFKLILLIVILLYCLLTFYYTHN